MTRFKNIGILAHVDAGKTTLTEQLLAVSGAISAPGTVDKGTATTDSLEVERRRGISVKTASVALPLGEDVINIVDTPGHTDFIGEVERSLAVLDGVVLVISAAEGVQAQTTLLLDAVRRLHLPALLVMNKLDRAGCDPPAVIEDVKRELSSDLVVMCDCLGAGESGVEIVQRSLDLEDFRDDLLLTLANTDPALEERYFAGEEIAFEELRQLFRQAIAEGRVYPLFFTCAKLGKGVAPLLSALGELLPWASGHDDDPLSGVIYRVQYDPSLGKLAHVRLFGGCLKNRDPLPLLGEEGEPEKIAQIKRYTAGKLQDSGRLCAGDIGVLTGISKARIGQIIGNEDVSRDCRLAVPLLMIKVTPDDPQQLPRMMQALSQLSEEDPLLDYEYDQDTREMLIRITGIIQIQILRELLETRYGLAADFSPPAIIYREQPSRTGRGLEEYTMPKPCWAVVELTVEPLPPGSGLQFRSAVKDNVLAYRYQHHVEQSMRQTFRQGVLGWQVDDALVTLVYGESHHEHTHPLDFFVATPIAALRALSDSQPILLEPWLRLVMRAESGLIDKVIGQIIAMRGEFSPPRISGSDFTMEAFVPLATSLDWPIEFQSLTSGKGRLGSSFLEYRPCPPGEGTARPRRGVDPLDKPKWILHCRGAI